VLGNVLFSNTTSNVIYQRFPTMNMVLGNTDSLTTTSNRFEVHSGNVFIKTNIECSGNIVGNLDGDIKQRGRNISQVKIETYGNVSLYSTGGSVTRPISLLEDTEIRGHLWMDSVDGPYNITLHPEGKYIGNAESWSFINSTHIVTQNRLCVGYPETSGTTPWGSEDANLYVSSNAIMGMMCKAGYFYGDISNTSGKGTFSSIDLTNGQLTVTFTSNTSNAVNITGNVGVNGILTADKFKGDISECTGGKQQWTNITSSNDVYIAANVGIGKAAQTSVSNALNVYGNVYVTGQVSSEQFFIVALSDEYGGLSVSNTSSMCTFRTPTKWMLTRPPRFTLETPLSNVNIPVIPILEYPPVALTSDNTPSGYTATANSITGSTYAAWYAFNKTNTNGASGFWRSATGRYTNAGIGSEWLRIQVPTPIILTGYDLSSPNDTTGSTVQALPKNWRVEGSNDGNNWFILDSRSDAFAATNQTKVFGSNLTSTNAALVPTSSAIGNATYTRFQILVTQINGGGLTYTSIGEWRLYGKTAIDSTISKIVSQTHIEFDIRTGTDNVYRGGSQTTLYSIRPFLRQQVDTFNTANSITQLSTTATNFGTQTGSLDETRKVIQDDTEVGVFLANAWTSINFTQGYDAPNRNVIVNTNATGAKVIFYYRTLFD
jgi:hypothetical protein